MANEELAEIQTAVLGHLELVRRLKTRAAELRKEIADENKRFRSKITKLTLACMRATRKADKADLESRAALQRLVSAQMAAKTGRLERKLGVITPQPIKRKSHRENQTDDGKA